MYKQYSPDCTLSNTIQVHIHHVLGWGKCPQQKSFLILSSRMRPWQKQNCGHLLTTVGHFIWTAGKMIKMNIWQLFKKLAVYHCGWELFSGSIQLASSDCATRDDFSPNWGKVGTKATSISWLILWLKVDQSILNWTYRTVIWAIRVWQLFLRGKISPIVPWRTIDYIGMCIVAVIVFVIVTVIIAHDSLTSNKE